MRFILHSIHWGCASGGAYVLYVYSHARWVLPQATKVFVVVFVWRHSSVINSLVCWFRTVSSKSDVCWTSQRGGVGRGEGGEERDSLVHQVGGGGGGELFHHDALCLIIYSSHQRLVWSTAPQWKPTFDVVRSTVTLCSYWTTLVCDDAGITDLHIYSVLHILCRSMARILCLELNDFIVMRWTLLVWCIAYTVLTLRCCNPRSLLGEIHTFSLIWL